MLALQLLAAASAAVLVSAQGPVNSGCTSSSFTIPSWYVQNLTYAGPDASSSTANLAFHILNRATNYTADLSCAVGSSGWNPCAISGKPSSTDPLQVSVQLTGTTARVIVNQTWTCNDRPTKALTFVAVGNNTVELNCVGQSCTADLPKLLIRGSLLSPVSLYPAYLDGPTGHTSKGCSSATPTWDLSTIYYRHQTGLDDEFSLLLANKATGYIASCMTGGGEALICAGNEFGSIGLSQYRPATTATFDPKTYTFSINQTWFCDEVNPGKPIMVVGSASVSIPLDCTTVDMSTDGTKTTCLTTGNVDVLMPGKVDSTTSLPAYSIEDPVAVADGCTLASIVSPQWQFSDFSLDNSAVTFSIVLRAANPGFQGPIYVEQDDPVAGSSWYPCILGSGGNTGGPLWPKTCSFQYAPATKQLTLKADWACNDLDPDHPVVFSGITTTTVNSTLTCSTDDGDNLCVTADNYAWNADIANVTWVSTP